MGTMSKEEILKILEDAKDKNSDVPMRLVRQAFEKLPEPCEDDKSCSNCMYSGRQTYKSPCSECRDNSQWEAKQPEPCEDKLARCRFEYINACKTVAHRTPDTKKQDIYDAYAVMKALQPIFREEGFE